jgi:hypothetical protein
MKRKMISASEIAVWTSPRTTPGPLSAPFYDGNSYVPLSLRKELERHNDADVRRIVGQAWWPKPIAH